MVLAQGWGGLDDVFWLTVLVIFLATVVGALLARWRKDKCLKLLGSLHVTYLTAAGDPLWGDLRLSSQGLELVYDAPYRTARGLAKTSYLVYADEGDKCLAVACTEHALTEEERAARRAQVRASFEPGPARRLGRALRNFVNTVRDAIVKTFSLFLGAITTRGTVGQAVGRRRGEVEELGQTVVGTVANAYEPLLERHVGRSVVLRVEGPTGPCEFPGFLVEYTQRHVAVFNTEHAPEESFEIETEMSVNREGLVLDLLEKAVVVSCPGPDALVVKRLELGDRRHDLGVVLLPGCRLAMPRPPGARARLEVDRTRRLDLVCPRNRARVRFGSEAESGRPPGWEGVAPEE